MDSFTEVASLVVLVDRTLKNRRYENELILIEKMKDKIEKKREYCTIRNLTRSSPRSNIWDRIISLFFGTSTVFKQNSTMCERFLVERYIYTLSNDINNIINIVHVPSTSRCAMLLFPVFPKPTNVKYKQ
jgi:hypothetical protein